MSQAEACIDFWIAMGILFLLAMAFRASFPLFLGQPGYY